MVALVVSGEAFPAIRKHFAFQNMFSALSHDGIVIHLVFIIGVEGEILLRLIYVFNGDVKK